MENQKRRDQLKADLAKLQENYNNSTGREVYTIGNKIRRKTKQLEKLL